MSSILFFSGSDKQYLENIEKSLHSEEKIMPEILALKNIRMDKTAFSVGSIDDESDEKLYWSSKTPVERIYTVELMRQMLYGYDPLTAGLQRFFETAEITDN